jgi:hypothetical protein
MPPEFFTGGSTFNYLTTDVFQSGVVLFTLVVGCPPFKTAQRSDAHYNLFLNNNEMFWRTF